MRRCWSRSSRSSSWRRRRRSRRPPDRSIPASRSRTIWDNAQVAVLQAPERHQPHRQHPHGAQVQAELGGLRRLPAQLRRARHCPKRWATWRCSPARRSSTSAYRASTTRRSSPATRTPRTTTTWSGIRYYVVVVAFNETAKFQLWGYYPQIDLSVGTVDDQPVELLHPELPQAEQQERLDPAQGRPVRGRLRLHPDLHGHGRGLAAVARQRHQQDGRLRPVRRPVSRQHGAVPVFGRRLEHGVRGLRRRQLDAAAAGHGAG